MKITIRAEDGMWLTDGANYGKTISLADDATIDKYYEITEEEFNNMQEELNNALPIVEGV